MRTVLVLAVCLFCILTPWNSQAKPVAVMAVAGRVTSVQGDVLATHKGAASGAPLRVGDAVYVADDIETGSGARLVIAFVDSTKLTVGANGKTTIDEYVFDPASPDTGHARLGILNAAFEYIDGKLGKAKKPSVRLDLNFGSIGIRGTKILRGMSHTECWVFLEEGSAEVFNEKGSVSLNAGQGTKMTDKKIAPLAAKKWTEADIGWIREALR